ncbi:MAG: bifunctional phosphopantothenoylcysteine decarboxylase/phosphopantothenate synthase [Gemmataceae bacterium]|nr:bifunctional phosphopantothenoylcysteine decarboxylase/phosphopantothenate synthase [Gemmataceae bacterium]
MRIFVTAGNTQVPIDRVRCITNIFTGRTGATIALEAYRRGHHVTLATSHPETVAQLQAEQTRWRCRPYRTFEELATLMAEEISAGKPDAVVQCAAVSDYHAAGIFAPAPGNRFDPIYLCWHGAPTLMVDCSAGKVKSDEPELWLRLVRAPKLVDKIRSAWNFAGMLVKFKLEVGVNESELQTVAEQSRLQSDADVMVANTLEGAADWALLGNAQGYKKVPRAELAGALLDVLESEAPRG